VTPALPPPPAPLVPPQPLDGLVAALRSAGLLAGAPEGATAGVAVASVAHDSRAVRPGALFVAVQGEHADGHQFLDAAAASGAVAALVAADGPGVEPRPLGKGTRPSGVVLVPVTDTRAALGEVAVAFYGRPGERLDLLGITGTNGKTTTAFLLHHLLETTGRSTGLVGTVETRIGRARYATTHTTPDALALAALLRRMADDGCAACAMEVSSHALEQERVRGLAFRAAVFTNLTHDHLDYHGTVEAYAAAKRKLFDGLGADAVAVVNADDRQHAAMTSGSGARVVTYGTTEGADVRVEVLENALAGLRLRLDGHERRFRLAGAFNALNLAAAYAVGRDLGLSAAEALDALADAPGVPGRFETFGSADGVLGVVDYAHTPDALENVLRTARDLMRRPEGAPAGCLWVVFGCGGDRDRAKRPAMGAIAERLADRLVLTSDNPRSEDPLDILRDVRGGLTRPAGVLIEPDRAAAIARATAAAAPGDVVVVAGKGHEPYQIVGSEVRAFDDRAHVRAALAHRAGAPPEGPRAPMEAAA
jgi:UDP-N-acetylmuramoyl-L-alanyl-D-glutamate--2,6-diaminopimelate ligase